MLYKFYRNLLALKNLHLTFSSRKIHFEGTEWDSSDDEDDAPVLPKTKQTKVKSAMSKGKKVVKYDGGKQAEEHDDDDEKNLVLYVGHLPKDFEEIDLRRFLTQFGKVYNCRLARKIETGQPKGFAFVRFGDDETARIACETLHGYFLEKQRLVCQLRPSHPGMFFDTDKNIDNRRKKTQLEARQRNKNLSNSEKLKEITSRLVSREMKKRDRLKALGIDYDFPGFKSNQADFEKEYVPEEEPEQEEAEEEVQDETPKKKRRKESMDSTTSEGSASKKKKKKKKRKDSIDSVGSTGSEKSKKDKKKKTKKKRSSSE